ncbi:MAG: hypothetical protein AB7T22_08485 [Calditrichaceae bacterium]
MQIKTLILLLFSGILFFQHCSGSKKSGSQQPADETYKQLAIQKYQNKITYSFNSDTTLVICARQEKPTSQRPFSNVQFFVYDLINESVVYEDQLPMGSVRWFDKDQLELNTIPGIVSGAEDNGARVYIVNLKTGKKQLRHGAKEVKKE